MTVGRGAIAIGVMAWVAIAAAAAPPVTDAQIAADGASVAFVRGGQLWRVPYGGGAPHRIADAGPIQSRWSIDGQRASLTRAADRVSLAIQPNRTLLSAFDVPSFDWSPDGRALVAIVTPERGAALRTVIVPLSGASRVVAMPSDSAREIAWLTDGERFAWLVAARGGDDSAPRVIITSAQSPAPKIVPIVDGTPIHIARAGSELAITFDNGRESWIVVGDATGASRVTVLPPGIARVTSAPSWSADGTRFAFAGATTDHAAEVFAGAPPMAHSARPDWVGAPPPPIRRVTFDSAAAETQTGWQVSLHVTGGFAGVDRRLELRSDGAMVATDRRRNRRLESRATERELAEIAAMVAAASSADSARSTMCRDCFGYALEIERGGQRLQSQFDDITLPTAPVRPLVATLNALLTRALARP